MAESRSTLGTAQTCTRACSCRYSTPGGRNKPTLTAQRTDTDLHGACLPTFSEATGVAEGRCWHERTTGIVAG